LKGSIGTWTGSPTSYRYEWLRCDTNGVNCSAIAGATAQTYSLTTADIASRIRFRVTASNAAGSSVATSEPASVVKKGNKGGNPPMEAFVAASPTFSFRAAGAIRTHHALQWFTVRSIRRTIRVRYFDPRARVMFRSLRITGIHVHGQRLVVGGRGVVHGRRHNRRVWFSVRITDRGRHGRVDRFHIQLSTGYHRRAHLVQGNITIR
jgi:hypothetical protein